MPTASALFSASSADTTFISSDDVVFKIHATHLTSGSAGFANAQNAMDVSEPVKLPEPSNVLELLFQFIEPPSEARNYRQPSVFDIAHTLFFALAEAAEKYIVYGAVNVCVTGMRNMVSKHPYEILNHSVKHGHSDLADKAARELVSAPFTEVAIEIKSPNALRKWLIYHDRWRDAADAAIMVFEEENARKCRIWMNTYVLYLRQLTDDPSSIETVPRVSLAEFSAECKMKTTKCDCKSVQYEGVWPWVKRLKEVLEEVPLFSEIDMDD